MSGEIGIIVQARMSSSRLPGKSLHPLGNHFLIFYVLRRLKLTGLPVIVCTSDHASDDVLCNYLQGEGFNFFRGSLQDVLQRYIETAESFNITKIIRATGDNPLVDIDFLLASMPLFQNYDYLDGIYPGGLIKGTGFEMVTLTELKNIPSNRRDHREHVTSWLRENMVKSARRINLIPNRVNKYRNDIFLTCDYSQDMDLLEKIFQHFKFRFDISIEEVIDFLDENPALKDLNKMYH